MILPGVRFWHIILAFVNGSLNVDLIPSDPVRISGRGGGAPFNESGVRGTGHGRPGPPLFRGSLAAAGDRPAGGALLFVLEQIFPALRRFGFVSSVRGEGTGWL